MKLYHMSGAGNDFMVMDAREIELDFSQLAVRACREYGTDGFMALDVSEIANFRLHFYNADGSRGEMCGNGARCICKFAYDLGLVGEEMTLQTDAGLVYGWHLEKNRYRVALNLPQIVDLHRREDAAYVELGDPGIPHSVTRLPGLTFENREQLRSRMRTLRYDPAFPKGANVNFYDWLDGTTVRILTYERGVEDFTLACGTGSASTAVVLWKSGQLPGGKLTSENPGGTLSVTLREEKGKLTHLFLEGPAETISVYEKNTF